MSSQRVEVYLYDRVWDMLRDVRAFCKLRKVEVISTDNPAGRTIGFTTLLQANSSDYREWRTLISNAITQGHDFTGGFPGLDEDGMYEILRLLRSPSSRMQLAQFLTLGQVGDLSEDGALLIEMGWDGNSSE